MLFGAPYVTTIDARRGKKQSGGCTLVCVLMSSYNCMKLHGVIFHNTIKKKMLAPPGRNGTGAFERDTCERMAAGDPWLQLLQLLPAICSQKCLLGFSWLGTQDTSALRAMKSAKATHEATLSSNFQYIKNWFDNCIFKCVICNIDLVPTTVAGGWWPHDILHWKVGVLCSWECFTGLFPKQPTALCNSAYLWFQKM